MSAIPRMKRQPARLMLLAALFIAVPCLGLRWARFTAAAQGSLTVVNAASFISNNVAPDSIAAAFGQFNTQNNQSFDASGVPLPLTLGGVRVTIDGVAAGLFFVSPTQVNFAVPAGAALGAGKRVVVTGADNSTREGAVDVVRGAPGLFTALSTGQGTAAGLTTFDGVTFQPIANPDGTERQVDPGTTQRPNLLVLFGTGWREARPGSVVVTVQGVPTRVDFAGAQPGFVGLDQLNIALPPELAGFGSVLVKVTAEGVASNSARVRVGGQLTALRASQINPGQAVSGALTADDQVQDAGDGSGRSYFFDAYRFRTSEANTIAAIDLRASQFDAAVILYRVGGGDILEQISADDQTGGLGNGNVENNNALLLAALPTPGEYICYATSSDFEPNAVGSYSMRLTTHASAPLAYSATPINASIQSTDITTSANDFLDVYWFNGAQNDRAQVRVTSSDFAPYVRLSRNDGTLVGEDVNRDLAGSAQVNATLPETGIYLIVVTPFEPNKSGAYSLALDRASGFAGAVEASAAAAAGTGRRTSTAFSGRAQVTRRAPQPRALERM